MSKWEDNVRKVVPYTPGEQPKIKNIIKLNTNENPYPPSPLVRETAIDMDDLKLYPDPAADLLVSAIAGYHGVDKNRVFVGVGSDDVLAMSFLAFFNSDKPILFPDVTYSFYDVWANLFRIPFTDLPLDDDFCIVPEDYERENGGVIFPNPNAPTGRKLELSKVRQIIEANRDVVVIVDEAYVDFGAESALPLTDEYDNLLVVRTFSKSRSMAGIRIGYAIGQEKLIKYLSDVKYSFNSYTMNRPSIVLGAASIKDDAYFKETIEKVVATRERTTKELEALGFKVLPSKANFVFASHDKKPAKEIFAAARERGIILRYFDKPRIDNFLRITIGTDEQMDEFIAFLKEFI
ncbi:MAG: histidinol-phosphate transaminase [Lachnospiraceae bacterium]|nr:histidinol-phosphate transaminase [Lachnospiraceae bacterium]